MNYYKRHLGDYARDTGHLTALEHGVYNLLLDWYYVNEKPIPPDKAVKIARGNPEETQSVLSEYFELTENGWVHHYADREIEKYRAKAAHNRDVGKLGGRPAKSESCEGENPKETQMVSGQNPDVTLATKPLIHDSKKEQDQKTVRRTARDAPIPDEARAMLAELPADLIKDFQRLRQAKKAPITPTAVKGIIREAGKAGVSLLTAVETCCERGWGGFKAEWYSKIQTQPNGNSHANHRLSLADRAAAIHAQRRSEPEGRGDAIDGTATTVHR